MGEISRKRRILFLFPGVTPPSKDERGDRFYYLSEYLEGDILLPTWWQSEADARAKLAIEPDFTFRRGSFCYHLSLPFTYPKPFRALAKLLFFLRTGHELIKRNRHDAIVSIGTNLTGVSARILSWLHRLPLIVEFPGVPSKAFIYDNIDRILANRLKKVIADMLLVWVVKGAKRVRLLYPQQLIGFDSVADVPSSSFHEFTPVSKVQPTGNDGKYILFVGWPWYLKGVDVLLKAFSSIEAEVPDVGLKLVGYVPDLDRLMAVAAGIPRVEILKPVPQDEAIKLIQSCSLLVLPSRTEGMGRVILEAMAAAKPVVASRVDGIPHYVEDGKTGLLFERENVEELAACLRKVLKDRGLAASLGEAGYEKLRGSYTEEIYAKRYEEMIAQTLGDS